MTTFAEGAESERECEDEMLRAALHRYGDHVGFCEMRHNPYAASCECGFADLLDRLDLKHRDYTEEGTMATPDATLDGLLDEYRRTTIATYRRTVPANQSPEAEARAAIHAHVAQREAALRTQVVDVIERTGDDITALRAEAARLRDVLRVARAAIEEAITSDDGLDGRAGADALDHIERALASPPPATAETTEARE